MIKVWSTVGKYFDESKSLSQFSPFWGNQAFIPGMDDVTFKIWASKGLKMICSFYSPQSDVFMSFGELQKTFNIPDTCKNAVQKAH